MRVYYKIQTVVKLTKLRLRYLRGNLQSYS